MAEGLQPVYLLHGDPSLVMEFAEGLKARVLRPGCESFNYHSYSATSMSAEEVLQTALTLPVFGGRRLVVVKDCQDMKEKDRALFVEYARAPSFETCLVLIYRDRPSSGDTLFSALTRMGYTREFKSPTGRRLEDWIKEYVRKEGKQITPQAVQTLIEMRGDNFSGLRAELDKLLLYSAHKPTIDRADVEESVLQMDRAGVFELTDAVGMGDKERALKAFSLLREEEPLKVLGVLAWYVRLLLRCKELIREGADPQQIASRLRIPGFRVDAYMRASARFSRKRLHRIMVLLSKADTLIKSSPVRPEDVMFRVVMELCR